MNVSLFKKNALALLFIAVTMAQVNQVQGDNTCCLLNCLPSLPTLSKEQLVTGALYGYVGLIVWTIVYMAAEKKYKNIRSDAYDNGYNAAKDQYKDNGKNACEAHRKLQVALAIHNSISHAMQELRKTLSSPILQHAITSNDYSYRYYDFNGNEKFDATSQVKAIILIIKEIADAHVAGKNMNAHNASVAFMKHNLYEKIKALSFDISEKLISDYDIKEMFTRLSEEAYEFLIKPNL